MSKDIKVFLDYLSSQTGMPIDQVSRETEESLAGVVEKKYPEGTRISVQIDENHGTLEIYRVWTIVQDGDDDLDPAINMTLTDALTLSPEAAVGEEELSVRLLHLGVAILRHLSNVRLTGHEQRIQLVIAVLFDLHREA